MAKTKYPTSEASKGRRDQRAGLRAAGAPCTRIAEATLGTHSAAQSVPSPIQARSHAAGPRNSNSHGNGIPERRIPNPPPAKYTEIAAGARSGRAANSSATRVPPPMKTTAPLRPATKRSESNSG